MIKSNQKGQVALVLVLIMTVVSALAVSLASRSTVDTRIQQTESESVQALLFAQTGLEQMIVNPDITSTAPDENYLAVKSDVGMDGFSTASVDQGTTIELNLEGATASLTGFQVYWKPDLENTGAQPSILVSLINDTGEISDYAYAYVAGDGFLVAEDGASEGYEKRTPVISLSSSVAKVRITVLKTPSLLKIVPVGAIGAAFPSQIKSIKSVGTVSSSDNSVKYGLQYDESTADSVPAVFDYALFSGGSIIQ